MQEQYLFDTIFVESTFYKTVSIGQLLNNIPYILEATELSAILWESLIDDDVYNKEISLKPFIILIDKIRDILKGNIPEKLLLGVNEKCEAGQNPVEKSDIIDCLKMKIQHEIIQLQKIIISETKSQLKESKEVNKKLRDKDRNSKIQSQLLELQQQAKQIISRSVKEKLRLIAEVNFRQKLADFANDGIKADEIVIEHINNNEFLILYNQENGNLSQKCLIDKLTQGGLKIKKIGNTILTINNSELNTFIQLIYPTLPKEPSKSITLNSGSPLLQKNHNNNNNYNSSNDNNSGSKEAFSR